MPKAARAKSKIVRPLHNGQITIPFEFREELGINEATLLRMTLEGDELHLRKLEVKDTSKGSPWLRELYAEFAPVRKDLASYDELEIDRAIDSAVSKVRGRHILLKFYHPFHHGKPTPCRLMKLSYQPPPPYPLARKGR